jgi:hypothetical protein
LAFTCSTKSSESAGTGAPADYGLPAHEVLDRSAASLPHCDPQGRILVGDHCSVTTTFRDGRALQNPRLTLLKQGTGWAFRPHRALLSDGVIVGWQLHLRGATNPSESSGTLMYGCPILYGNSLAASGAAVLRRV